MTAHSTPEGPVDLASAPERFANRELSWLDFAHRLVDLASDRRLPLLERIRFLAISAEGLDEFFQVRVSALDDRVAAGIRTRSADGMSPTEQLAAIWERVEQLMGRQAAVAEDLLAVRLVDAGVTVVGWDDLGADDRAWLGELFDHRMFPILTPLAVDQGHPFPYISNLSLNILVRVVDPGSGSGRIARVKVPPLLPRFVALPDRVRLIPVEHVIAAHLDRLFPAMEIGGHHVFRVTRNADLSVDEDDAEDLLAAVELELHRRRFGQAVRLEVTTSASDDLVAMLVREIDIDPGRVVPIDGLVDLSGLRALCDLDRPDLTVEPWTPVPPPRLAGQRNIFEVLATGDVLVHHPYESFADSVEAFVTQAAVDPAVVAIKQTLYRTGLDSPIVDALVRAARSGKEVTVVVELQARFDERANIAWARALEEAGAQVIYGLARLKTHSKISLVLRREGEVIRRYCHIGSGNYNSITARMYEDVGLLTADPEIGVDISELISLLAGGEAPVHFRRLVVSPVATRPQVIAAIEAEAAVGPLGRIVIKTNGLTDPAVIDALYRASSAGVPIDLVVRGRCCLRPGVPGLSETIRVHSVVGRFLEHSRIFRFGGTSGRPLRVSFGSPDLMERNLDRRIEVLVPVHDEAIRDRLAAILDDAVADEANAWLLGPDGQWTRCDPDDGIPSQAFSLQARCRSLALAAWERGRADGQPSSVADVEGPDLGSGPPFQADSRGIQPAPSDQHVPPSPAPDLPDDRLPRRKRWWHRWFRVDRRQGK